MSRAFFDDLRVLALADSGPDAAPRSRCTCCGVVTVQVRFGRILAPVRPGEYRADDPRHPCQCVAEWVPVHD
jgi:hypothetical protein